MHRRFVEMVAPARLGPGFRWLLASSWLSNLADGMALASGPLLVASMTHNAVLVATAATLSWLPPFAFGLLAGAITDRLDRRRIMITTNAVRAGILTLLALGLATGAGRVPVGAVLAVLFVLGTAEVFADNASSTVLPMVVERDDLAVANARLQTGFITVNQLIGPMLGATLFAVGSAWPIAVQGGLVAAGALLVRRMSLPPRDRPHARVRSHLRRDILEGLRWVAGHAAVRTLVLTILIFNVAWGAAWSVLVLYSRDRLGLSEVGFGVITTVTAVGGLAGTGAYGWITRHVSLGALMRIGLIIETLTHLALAVTTSPGVAMPIFFVFGAHAFVWGTTSITVRQRAVPEELQGRVGSINSMGTFGGLVVGSAIGGLLAHRWGVTAPFWFAFVGSAVFVVAMWRQLAHVAHADD